MKNPPTLLWLLLLLLTCCATTVDKIFESGKIKQRRFKEQVDFTFENNLPFVIVEINNQTYKFLLDTGAPTVVSPRIVEDLKLRSKFAEKMKDSQGNSRAEKLVVIPEMKLGNLTFINTGAVVLDLQKTFEFKCLQVDGILGANQMAKAVWRIDYQNQQLDIANRLGAFDTTGFGVALNFTPKRRQQTPLIKSELNSKPVLFTYDTGYDGSLKVNQDIELFQDDRKIEFEGIDAVGAYGAGKNRTGAVVKVDSITIDTLTLQNQLIVLGNSDLIGNTFLKNFTTILDWNANKIYLKTEHPLEDEPIKTFGFSYIFINNTAVVVQKYKDAEHDILVGDKIIAINGVDFTNLTEEEACNYRFNPAHKNAAVIEVIYERDNERMKAVVELKEYLE